MRAHFNYSISHFYFPLSNANEIALDVGKFTNPLYLFTITMLQLQVYLKATVKDQSWIGSMSLVLLSVKGEKLNNMGGSHKFLVKFHQIAGNDNFGFHSTATSIYLTATSRRIHQGITRWRGNIRFPELLRMN